MARTKQLAKKPARKATKAPRKKAAVKAAVKATPKVAAKTVSKPAAKVAAAPTKTAATPVAVQKTETTLSDAFVQVLGQLTSLRSQLTNITGQVRALQKRADRELRAAHKLNKKRSSKSGTRAPSGFVKPTKISKELALFLNKPHGTEMARTQVTREINTYIRAHKLQDPKNGRRILADTALRKLLKLNKDDELTYFNLQRYMSPHFAKATKAVAPKSS